MRSGAGMDCNFSFKDLLSFLTFPILAVDDVTEGCLFHKKGNMVGMPLFSA